MQVEDVWKTTEFTVLSHGDAKEVFILGGTDEIQVVTSWTRNRTSQSVLKHQQCVSIFNCVFPCLSAAKVLLDDSIISVGTAASSRYVAPIKLKVDKFLRQLNLFNQTLVKE